MAQPLPSLEWLLMLADFCHNITDKTGERRNDTFAVGAIGENALRVQLVIGINSNNFHEVRILAERNIPPDVRKRYELADCIMAKEPYHAEVSPILWAKDHSLKVLSIASSRKVCPTCNDLLLRHAPEATVVDGWIKDGNQLTQKERTQITGPQFTDTEIYRNLKAIRM